MIEIVNQDECNGCKTCGNICPKDAIRFVEDKEGFWYPSTNTDKCINCGLCVKKCPVLNQREEKVETFKPEVYKAFSVDGTIRKNSTSGGIYYLIANRFIKKDSYICGCAFTDDLKGAEHILGNTQVHLNQIYRSKYFQSDIKNVYREIKELLMKNKEVLFCGTPCQVGGLYSFLGKDYPTLFTLDFICRGINSPKAYRRFIEELEAKYHSKISSVHFKCKDRGWDNLSTKITFENGKEYLRDKDSDPWVNGFINGNLYMRKSCEKCHFRTVERQSDITLGDFWGMNFTKTERKLGVSMLMINSEKGKHLFEMIADEIEYEQRSVDEVLKGNPAIISDVKSDNRRTVFFDNVDNELFSKLVWKLLGWSSPILQIRYIKKKLEKKIHELL